MMSFDPKTLEQLSVAQLAALVDEHNTNYFIKNQSVISDIEFDALTRALRAKAPDHEVLTKIYVPSFAEEIPLKKPMLSLDKAYSLDEVLKWANKFARSEDERMLVQPKYDGISAVYEEGLLLTRGDGHTGVNITDKLPLIRLETPGYCGGVDRDARGEILIKKTEFARWQKSGLGGRVFKNPRNTAAGLLGRETTQNILAVEHIEKLFDIYLYLVDYSLISNECTLREFPELWSRFTEEFEALPYPMDGIVIKFADTAFAESLGGTEHHPYGAIAYKFSNLSKKSKIVDIQWGFGKNSLTPVALVEPIEINGSTISKVTLHNLQNVLERDIQVGDSVTIERAGDVIPYVSAVEPGAERVRKIPATCSACGTALVQRGVELCCPNPLCSGTCLQKLYSACKTLEINDLGESTLSAIMTQFNVRTLSDLFKLKTSDFLQLEGFAEKRAKKLYDAIQSHRNVSESVLLSALNIHGISHALARMILAHMPLEKLRTATVDELLQIKGIGPERAALIIHDLKAEALVLDELLAALHVLPETLDSQGRSVCFTGKMPQPRSFYGELARANGYRVSDTVTSALDLLVCADENDHSEKLRKARELNVAVMPLDAWLATLPKPPETPENDTFEQLELF